MQEGADMDSPGFLEGVMGETALGAGYERRAIKRREAERLARVWSLGEKDV